jgi:ferredoxin
MLHTLADARTAREVWWVHGARDGREHAFGAEIDRLLAALPRAHRLVSFSRPDPGDSPGAAFDTVGRLSIETIAAAGIPTDADYYLCGPDAFMQSLSAALIARGAPPEHVAMEVFGAKAVTFAPGLDGKRRSPHPPSGPPAAGPAVTFSRSNLTLPWDQSYGNLLEFAEACDIPVNFGCRIGVCHYCETGLLTGEVTYTSEPLEPPDGEHVLLCCSRPTGEVTLEL